MDKNELYIIHYVQSMYIIYHVQSMNVLDILVLYKACNHIS